MNVVLLKIEIQRDNFREIVVIGTVYYQHSYVKKIIDKFDMSEANELSVSAKPHTTLLLEVNSSNVKHVYREAVGSLMFLSVIS